MPLMAHAIVLLAMGLAAAHISKSPHVGEKRILEATLRPRVAVVNDVPAHYEVLAGVVYVLASLGLTPDVLFTGNPAQIHAWGLLTWLGSSQPNVSSHAAWSSTAPARTLLATHHNPHRQLHASSSSVLDPGNVTHGSKRQHIDRQGATPGATAEQEARVGPQARSQPQWHLTDVTQPGHATRRATALAEGVDTIPQQPASSQPAAASPPPISLGAWANSSQEAAAGWAMARWHAFPSTDPPGGPSRRADLVICISPELAPAVCRSAVKELRPQLLVLWVHRADTITATSKMLGIHGRIELVALAPHVAQLASRRMKQNLSWAMPVAPYFPLAQPAALSSTQGTLPLEVPLQHACLSRSCLDGFALQGALRQFRSKQRQGFTRNYTALWQRLVELKAGAPVDSGRPASPAAVKVRVKVLGKGLKRQLGIPEALDADVDHFAQLPYPEFWAHIHRSLALVPAFGMSVYYESRISSTILASFITSTPLIAEQRLLDTYPFLTPAHVFLREPGEDEAAAMYRVASMPDADIFDRRAAMQQLRLQLNTDSSKLFQRWLNTTLRA
ncbi:hypothetical protein V8C86DRAFT_2492617 [Haematococcus lacustris]